ncbi:MAG: hypothetical protein V2B17_02415, partial [Chloroflexota bacterium]
TTAAWAWWSYVGASVAVVFLTVHRVVIAIEARRAGLADPGAAIALSGARGAAARRPSPLDLRAPGR